MSEEKEKTVDEKVAELTPAEKDYHLAVFGGLMGSSRFVEFVRGNYEIQKILDHENKSYEVRVIEKPVAVGPKMSPGQVFKLQELLMSYGVRDAVDCVKNVLKVLGQESSPIITPEGARIISLSDAKKKLD